MPSTYSVMDMGYVDYGGGVNAELRPVLKKAGLLTRDPRMKERKKPGLKRARKAPQYTRALIPLRALSSVSQAAFAGGF